jgi:hypothetical protein
MTYKTKKMGSYEKSIYLDELDLVKGTVDLYIDDMYYGELQIHDYIEDVIGKEKYDKIKEILRE